MNAATSQKDRSVETEVAGDPRSTKSAILETGAALTQVWMGPNKTTNCHAHSLRQDFAPVKSICAHLNAFHVYASDPKRIVETNHYCGHLTEDVRQCLLYDSPGPGARLIGVEYMISPALYETLDQEERRLWHSHVFEVKSGMLVMPQPSALVPQAAWEKAEIAEMEQVIRLYGKVYHLWQVDKGHKLPLGEPQLMTSITAAEQIPDLDKTMDARDERFPGTSWRKKKELREHIPEPKVHPGSSSIPGEFSGLSFRLTRARTDADFAWKK